MKKLLALIKLCRHLSKIIDLGGNIGLFSILSARICPLVEIVVFEAGSATERLLRINVALNEGITGKITVENKAIGGECGKVYWNYVSDNPGMSYISEKNINKNSLEIEQMSLSEILQRYRNEKLFIKMDIEGSEHDAINFTKREDWAPVDALLIEIHSGVERELNLRTKIKEFGFIERKIANRLYFYER